MAAAAALVRVDGTSDGSGSNAAPLDGLERLLLLPPLAPSLVLLRLPMVVAGGVLVGVAAL